MACSAPLRRIDHLLYAVRDLEEGCRVVEELLGVAPAVGGRHPEYGTHNALLSLGPTTYLEVIAPDPEADPAPRGVLAAGPDASSGLPGELLTWVLRAERLEAAARDLRAAGIDPGRLLPGRRERPDGSELTWRLTDPYARPLDGAVPFLIAWGRSPHPAASAPVAGRLTGLHIEHPAPSKVRAALAVLRVTPGGGLTLAAGERFAMRATIRTEAGEVQLG